MVDPRGISSERLLCDIKMINVLNAASKPVEELLGSSILGRRSSRYKDQNRSRGSDLLTAPR